MADFFGRLSGPEYLSRSGPIVGRTLAFPRLRFAPARGRTTVATGVAKQNPWKKNDTRCPRRGQTRCQRMAPICSPPFGDGAFRLLTTGSATLHPWLLLCGPSGAKDEVLPADMRHNTHNAVIKSIPGYTAATDLWVMTRVQLGNKDKRHCRPHPVHEPKKGSPRLSHALNYFGSFAFLARRGGVLVSFGVNCIDRAVMPAMLPSCIVSTTLLGTMTSVEFCLSPS